MARLALELLLHDVEHRGEQRAHRLIRQRAVVRRCELLQELGLALRVDLPRARRVLVLLNLGDELEAAVERVEELAVERRDLLAKVGQLDRHVHGLQSACSRRSGPDLDTDEGRVGLPLQRDLL